MTLTLRTNCWTKVWCSLLVQPIIKWSRSSNMPSHLMNLSSPFSTLQNKFLYFLASVLECQTFSVSLHVLHTKFLPMHMSVSKGSAHRKREYEYGIFEAKIPGVFKFAEMIQCQLQCCFVCEVRLDWENVFEKSTAQPCIECWFIEHVENCWMKNYKAGLCPDEKRHNI